MTEPAATPTHTPVGQHAITAAPAFKRAFFDRAVDLLHSSQDTAGVYVCFGAPDTLEREDIIEIGAITSTQNPALASRTRPRDEQLELTVTISCFRAGGPEMEQIVSDRCYELLGVLERHFRLEDPTVAGTVLWCFLTGHTSEGETDPDALAKGRVIDVTATFTAVARINK